MSDIFFLKDLWFSLIDSILLKQFQIIKLLLECKVVFGTNQSEQGHY